MIDFENAPIEEVLDTVVNAVADVFRGFRAAAGPGITMRLEIAGSVARATFALPGDAAIEIGIVGDRAESKYTADGVRPAPHVTVLKESI